jgi:hypothetical protein
MVHRVNPCSSQPSGGLHVKVDSMEVKIATALILVVLEF